MTAATAERGGRGVNRVLAKLDTSLESGSFYEAHQMYRTLYFRYTAQKKYEDCLNLLYEGALKLLEKQQHVSGADLALLVVDTLQKRGQCDDLDEWIDRLGLLIKTISPATVERETVINRAIKWTGDVSKNKYGHPTMHNLVAQVMWSEGNTELAHHHYLLSRDGVSFGKMLIKLSETKGYPSELDIFIVQVVLQQLCLKDKETALETFTTYTKYHPKIGQTEPLFKLPLLNFTYLLLKTIDTGRLETFETLKMLYSSSLSRDPSYKIYLRKIGVVYFGESPALLSESGTMGGAFGDLFSRLFQGFEDAEDEPSTEQTAELD